MTTLQLIIKKAKALKKAAPRKYSKWTDYVKAASATIKPKKKATVSGIKKKAATKKAAKKSTSYHKDTKSHNVRINVVSGVNLTSDQINFIEKEGKRSKSYKYRGKILWGSPIILKETENGTPVEKFTVDSLEVANYIASELNKGKKYTKVKSKFIK